MAGAGRQPGVVHTLHCKKVRTKHSILGALLFSSSEDWYGDTLNDIPSHVQLERSQYGTDSLVQLN